jgi:hypothetical protein
MDEKRKVVRMSYFGDLEETVGNVFVTENGALGFKTTNNPILDLNFKVASLRSLSDTQLDSLCQEYIDTIYTPANGNPVTDEQKKYFIKWLFYLRDVRGGLGERRSFRAFFKNKVLAQILGQSVKTEKSESLKESATKILGLIPEYGRWDDVVALTDKTFLQEAATKMLFDQINSDIGSTHPSLLAKWMPSTNASSKKSRLIALKLCKEWGWTERQYRKTMSGLRQRIGIVETAMSQNQWGEINYERVPSKANVLYKDAFKKHDEERREQFLEQVESGEKKINSGTNFPHDIVAKYGLTSYRSSEKDATLEALWKALPDMKIDKPFIVVADGSGSMTSHIGKTNTSALDVANAISIYFSERLSGEFKNKYITFSGHPQFVDLSKAKTLRDKILEALKHDECANTNIEAVFELLLSVAVKKEYKQEEIPNVLIISDMEFDDATSVGWGEHIKPKLFQTIEKKWKDKGYELPKLVFWNVDSSTGTIPMKENEHGVTLVSGFSQNIIKTVMSGKLDPWEALKETLDGERYSQVPYL